MSLCFMTMLDVSLMTLFDVSQCADSQCALSPSVQSVMTVGSVRTLCDVSLPLSAVQRQKTRNCQG